MTRHPDPDPDPGSGSGTRARRPDPDPPPAQARELRLALTGAPPRTPGVVAGLAAAAGWRLAGTVALGWGYEARPLTGDAAGAAPEGRL
ncbi:hypothetical protein RM844_21420 [Streptomyces sp. DSM 44915]|uniref:Uncharacterized protein n=1 Tax=Streptomyces chisholmiae TaxID=3075540 RepID=A0ABU2JVB6_9ACTN|nr:hypothetical protein [Streptomyces sp. DSM 44915]MDT0268852.1 hypothetical protein [Streptomyces sp. DSM 44915]